MAKFRAFKLSPSGASRVATAIATSVVALGVFELDEGDVLVDGGAVGEEVVLGAADEDKLDEVVDGSGVEVDVVDGATHVEVGVVVDEGGGGDGDGDGVDCWVVAGPEPYHQSPYSLP